jgi:hypothetical protein
MPSPHTTACLHTVIATHPRLLIFRTELVLTVLMFRTELVLTVLVFRTELVLILRTELVLTVLIFGTEIVLTVHSHHNRCYLKVQNISNRGLMAREFPALGKVPLPHHRCCRHDTIPLSLAPPSPTPPPLPPNLSPPCSFPQHTHRQGGEGGGRRLFRRGKDAEK